MTSCHFAPTASRRRDLAGAALFFACFLAGCSSLPLPAGLTTGALPAAAPAPPKPQTVAVHPARITMILPLGSMDASAPVAKAMKQAGEMALFDFNDPMIQLTVKDDKGTAEGAQAAAAEAIREGSEIIIGPLHTTSAEGAAAASRASNVPMISFASDRRVAGQGVYLLTFMVEQEIDRIVAYAVARGKKRFAALIPADGYGAIVEPAFRQALRVHGATMVSSQVYNTKPDAMVENVRRTMDAIRSAERAGQPIDALFVPAGPDVLPQLGPLLVYSGFEKSKVQLLGTGAWDYANIGAETAFAGGWYPSADPRGFRELSKRFQRTFGTVPPRSASLAYDAVALAIKLATSNPPGHRYTAANLMRPSGFNGTDGLVRFAANGACERVLAVMEVAGPEGRILDLPAAGAHVADGNAKVAAAR